MSNPAVEQLYRLAPVAMAEPPRGELERLACEGESFWADFIAYARGHGLLPMAHGAFARAGLLNSIPNDAAAALKKAHAASVAACIVLMGLHARIAEAAEKAGVGLMPLKGAHLGGRYYAEGERPMSDIDYLVEPGGAARAREMMLGLGYEPRRGRRLSREFEEKYSGEDKFDMFAAGMKAQVEIHSEPLPTTALRAAFPLRPEMFWERAARGTGMPPPCPEHSLLFGAIHLAAVHAFARLIWVADVDRIIRCEKLNEDLLVDSAARARSGALLRVVLRAAARLLGTPLPDGLEGKLHKGFPRVADAQIDRWLSGGANARGAALVPYYLSDGRAAYIARHLFPPPAFIMLRYNSPWWKAPVYYAVRPFSLAAGAAGIAKRGDEG